MGICLATFCALAIWYLGNIEKNRLLTEVEHYLKQHAAFDDWRAEHGDS
jgi:hypothetical protein